MSKRSTNGGQRVNVNDTIIKDGFWKASEICTAQYAAACKKAGVQ